MITNEHLFWGGRGKEGEREWCLTICTFWRWRQLLLLITGEKLWLEITSLCLRFLFVIAFKEKVVLPLKQAFPKSILIQPHRDSKLVPTLTYLSFSKDLGQYFKAKTLKVQKVACPVRKHVANCNDCHDESEEQAFQTTWGDGPVPTSAMTAKPQRALLHMHMKAQQLCDTKDSY